MKKYFTIIFAVLFLTACQYNTTQNNFVKINDKKIKVEIADTPESQYKGLSNRENLCADCGMLFKFKDKQARTFVMREMKFGLDIIWIDGNLPAQAGIIIGVDKNLLPEGADYKNFYPGPAPVDYVLEVNAGFADENNIGVGDKVVY